MKRFLSHISRQFLGHPKDHFRAFSPRKRILFYVTGVIALVLIASGLIKLNNAFLVTVPVRGGSLSEGLVGIPRLINPVLATSNTDRDLTALIYAGLLKHNAAGGYEPELAKSYAISDDGRTYTVTLKEGLTWHDGKPVTPEDVVFTIHTIQNDPLRSPIYPNWGGITVEKKDPDTVIFTLEKPYGPFLENLTVGILPKHLWKNETVKEFPHYHLNRKPVGSGPYQVAHIERDENGIPKSYTLKAFKNYALGEPFIQKIMFHFYKDNKALLAALENGTIQSASRIPPQMAKQMEAEGFRIETAPLLRVFAVFLNQDENTIFTDKAVRKALSLAADKEQIIHDAFAGFAFPIHGPLPQKIKKSQTTQSGQMAKAKQILEDAGWVYDEKEDVYKNDSGDTLQTLTFEVSTSKDPALKKVATALKKNWEVLGAKVTLKFLPIHKLTQEVIRTREYEALLFGQVTGHRPDLYAFWHSSQKLDPGLNVGIFESSKADTLLEQARTATSTQKRKEAYSKFTDMLQKAHPATFLYSPKFIYIVPPKLHRLKFGPIATGSDRFFNISKWYVRTQDVWPIFTQKK